MPENVPRSYFKICCSFIGLVNHIDYVKKIDKNDEYVLFLPMEFFDVRDNQGAFLDP